LTQIAVATLLELFKQLVLLRNPLPGPLKIKGDEQIAATALAGPALSSQTNAPNWSCPSGDGNPSLAIPRHGLLSDA